MSSQIPLQGTELVDCAKANENQDVAIAAERCGYGSNVYNFEQQLRNACEHIGVHIQGFSDLKKGSSHGASNAAGVIVAPEADGQL